MAHDLARDSLGWLYGDPVGPDGLVAGMYGVVPRPLAQMAELVRDREAVRPHLGGSELGTQLRFGEVPPMIGLIMGILAALASN